MEKCIILNLKNSVSVYYKTSDKYEKQQAGKNYESIDESFCEWIENSIDLDRAETFLFTDCFSLNLEDSDFLKLFVNCSTVESVKKSDFTIAIKDIFPNYDITYFDIENKNIIVENLFIKDSIDFKISYPLQFEIVDDENCPKKIDTLNDENTLKDERSLKEEDCEKSNVKLFFEKLL